ncbi:MAG: hypothetical protein R2780_05910 [Crocinitomicaceae bacterium]|nr:hypothetical protein [Crocinitomicaceae bacterium]
MSFTDGSIDEALIILDIYIPGYRFIELKDEDVIRVYGVAVFVDEEMMQLTMETFREICNGKRRKLFVDPTLEIGMTDEARSLLKNELPAMASALALMTNNVFTQISANLLMKVSNDDFKVKLFRDHEKALDWVREQ